MQSPNQKGENRARRPCGGKAAPAWARPRPLGRGEGVMSSQSSAGGAVSAGAASGVPTEPRQPGRGAPTAEASWRRHRRRSVGPGRRFGATGYCRGWGLTWTPRSDGVRPPCAPGQCRGGRTPTSFPEWAVPGDAAAALGKGCGRRPGREGRPGRQQTDAGGAGRPPSPTGAMRPPRKVATLFQGRKEGGGEAGRGEGEQSTRHARRPGDSHHVRHGHRPPALAPPATLHGAPAAQAFPSVLGTGQRRPGQEESGAQTLPSASAARCLR